LRPAKWHKGPEILIEIKEHATTSAIFPLTKSFGIEVPSNLSRTL